MSVRKREWTTPKGQKKSAWVADYTDQQGKRHLKTFKLKKEADAFAATASVEIREGTHVADSASVTVEKAGQFWLTSGEAAGLERSTINQRKRHLKFHIEPLIGQTLLSKLTVPAVRDFEDRLRWEGRSPAMIKKVLGSLGSILSDAQERGLTVRNPAREMRARRKGDKRHEGRHRARLRVGEDIPTREEIKALVGVLSGRWRPLLLVAIFAGLRSSELRGLRWQDVDLEGRTISVRQRADEFGEIGRPKSEAGERSIPVPPMVINALKEWKLGYSRPVIGRDEDRNPIREDAKPNHLIFANGNGKVESHANIVNRGLVPTMIAAGVTVDTGERDQEGKPILKAKYTGLHALRHFYASWLINRQADGGLGLPLKVVQERMGHSSITMTADTYGHLFPRGDDADELAAAEASLLGA
ncbi:site-specific integrase [Sinorhizobium meliloti]|uniref:tyrosine-type recombinase/integrase n=1 Tax=Rhizobium meliloti TaxID=382 RepID=UPI000FDAB49D|nr:site-specific integrase [Sinorhizobium meliloti]RVH28181.1 site-specific integrase [Sinorhizobium meliloti]RVQ41676.1 site-specific integrase [Sinorhizobium meliloti]